jgi:hypothetical protein
MVKVSTPSIPVVVPVGIMTCDDVIAKAGEALIQLPCALGTRSLCAGSKMILLPIRRRYSANGVSYRSIRSSVVDRLPGRWSSE